MAVFIFDAGEKVLLLLCQTFENGIVLGQDLLLMFAVGVGSLGWMFVLGAVMAIEKNVSWGKRVSAPLGALLLIWGLIITITLVI